MSNKIDKNNGLAMKAISALTSAILLIGATTGYANAARFNVSEGINSPEDLLRFQEQMARASEKDKESLLAGNVKMQAMHDYAKSVAIRAAMSSRFDGMEGIIAGHSRELDAIYNFEPLMIQQRVVPPVITEARDLYNQSGKLQIRLSKALFNIERQAYFSSTAPNWREYLKFPKEGNAYGKFAYVGGDMQPKNNAEGKIWADATAEGWELGSRQANVVLEQAMERLNRDYIGMIRFHTLVLEGKVTMPSVSSYNLYDSNNGSRLIVGEELLQIDILPTFKDQFKVGPGTVGGSQRQLNDIGNRIETPKALDRAPIKEVYDTVARIRNEQDITNKPWKDKAPISRSTNPLERPVTINIEVTRNVKPIVVKPTKGVELTPDQLNNLQLEIQQPESTEQSLRPYESPLL